VGERERGTEAKPPVGGNAFEDEGETGGEEEEGETGTDGPKEHMFRVF